MNVLKMVQKATLVSAESPHPSPTQKHTLEPGWVLGPHLSLNVLACALQQVHQQLLPQRGLLIGQQLPGGLDDAQVRLLKHAEEATDITHICHQQEKNRWV